MHDVVSNLGMGRGHIIVTPAVKFLTLYDDLSPRVRHITIFYVSATTTADESGRVSACVQ